MKALELSAQGENMILPMLIQIRGVKLKSPVNYRLPALFFRSPETSRRALLTFIVIEKMGQILAEEKIHINPPSNKHPGERAVMCHIRRIAWEENGLEKTWENSHAKQPYSYEKYRLLWRSIPDAVRKAFTDIVISGITIESG